MKDNIHKCNYCGRSFSRKWNASRHNRLKHPDLTHISEAKYRPNQYPSRTQNKFFDYGIKFKLLSNVESQLNYHESDIYFSDYFSANPVDIKIIKIIDQVIKPFEELEKLLGRINDETKAFILLTSLYSSLQREEPIKSMYETVELYRSMKGTKKIAKYMPMMPNRNVEPFEEPIEILKEKIKKSYIFKRYNN
jgi:hypothetical protein